VLAHSRTLHDLRIADDGGHQVPYLLERRDEPTLVEVPLARAPSLPGQPVSPRTSIYKVTLPYDTLPDGHLVIVTPARVFRRQVQLLAPRPAGASTRLPPTQVITTREFSHADPESPAGPLILPLPANAPRELFLTVDEGDNTPLPLGAAHLELDGFRLRFFPGGASALSLLYGQPALSAPSYDLSLLAPRLAGANADEVSLGPEAARAPAAPTARAGMTAFWIVLVAAVLVLLGLMAVMLRKEEKPQRSAS